MKYREDSGNGITFVHMLYLIIIVLRATWKISLLLLTVYPLEIR